MRWALTSGERTTLTAAIWAAATSGLTTAGTIGKLIVDNLNAAVVAWRQQYGACDTHITGGSLTTAPLDAAGVRAAVGLASANLDTQLSGTRTVVDAIKTKTDQLIFTNANRLDVHVVSMATNSITADAAAADFIGAAEIAASASQEIADLIAADCCW